MSEKRFWLALILLSVVSFSKAESSSSTQPNYRLNGTATLSSNFVEKGLTQTKGDPGLQSEFWFNFGSQFRMGLWGANVRYEDTPTTHFWISFTAKINFINRTIAMEMKSASISISGAGKSFTIWTATGRERERVRLTRALVKTPQSEAVAGFGLIKVDTRCQKRTALAVFSMSERDWARSLKISSWWRASLTAPQPDSLKIKAS